MAKRYFPKEIEPKWQKKWAEEGLYLAEDFEAKKKFYLLVEFPYPSGAGLHVGHVRAWSAMDAYARKKRMEGFNVLYPMGWDAFGLPAENYAIKMGVHPSQVVPQNIARFKEQLENLGMSFDWSREINTTDPKYYKWTQWIFLKFFEKGLAYQSDVAVNWCPNCKTNLADEEVLPNGTHERCGCPTERRMQKQWLLRITSYAERLLNDLKLVNYSPTIVLQQVNWIGKSEGTLVKFKIVGAGFMSARSGGQPQGLPLQEVDVFTTAIDTIFGTSFMVIAPELAQKYLSYIDDKYGESVSKYIEASLKKSELERQSEGKIKTGVDTGIKAINPFTKKEIPIWVADYVLASYGTGVVMGVPGHDRRDYEFAKKYNLSIIPVIKPTEDLIESKMSADGFWSYSEIAQNPDQAVLIDSGNYSGMTAKDAKVKLVEELVNRKIGEKVVNYHLRDWVFSRQHYWGEPIPVIHCEKCGVVPVPEKDLPVELPYLEKYEPSGTGESPLALATDWVNVECPECGGKAKRETDTMPNWAGSNWYYLRYIDPQNDKALADQKKMDYWMPVDLYEGGFEHTTLHLLYSRFVYKFLFDIGVVANPEPYAKRISHGIVLASDSRKMSKSFGNVINPDDIVKVYGADTLRIYEMFMGPFEQTIAWSENSLNGCFRFLSRVWELSLEKDQADKSPDKLKSALNNLILKVGSDLENFKFNTAVAALMSFINEWQSSEIGLEKSDLEKFLLILSPFAPHMTEELYQLSVVRHQSSDIRKSESCKLKADSWSIHQQSWPEVDKKYLEEESVKIMVSINGKVRDFLLIEKDILNSESDIVNLAKNSPKTAKYLSDKIIKRTVYVPGKIINFVI